MRAIAGSAQRSATAATRHGPATAARGLCSASGGWPNSSPRAARSGRSCSRAPCALAARKPAAAGLNVPDFAWAFLNPGNSGAIARPYYGRLDRAERAVDQTNSNIEETAADA